MHDQNLSTLTTLHIQLILTWIANGHTLGELWGLIKTTTVTHFCAGRLSLWMSGTCSGSMNKRLASEHCKTWTGTAYLRTSLVDTDVVRVELSWMPATFNPWQHRLCRLKRIGTVQYSVVPVSTRDRALSWVRCRPDICLCWWHKHSSSSRQVEVAVMTCTHLAREGCLWAQGQHPTSRLWRGGGIDFSCLGWMGTRRTLFGLNFRHNWRWHPYPRRAKVSLENGMLPQHFLRNIVDTNSSLQKDRRQNF